LAARLRLAGALAGREVGQPIASAVRLGSQEMPAAKIEQLVAELLRARQERVEIDSLGPAENYTIKPWASLPARWEGRDAATALVRCAAVGFSPQAMMVTTPGIAIALNAADGHLLWTQATAADSLQRGPGTACQTLSIGGHLYLRRLRSNGSELACLDASDGHVVWTTPAAVDVASAPIWTGQQLLAIVTEVATPGNLSVKLAQFDAQSGEISARWPVLEVRDLWKGSLSCRAATAGDRIVASLAGCVVCCDMAGRVLWLRTETYFARPLDASWAALRQTHSAPLIQQNRVFVAQPGVWAVDCLDLETGRLVWRRAEPELKSLLSLGADRLILETVRGVTALDPASGKSLWHYDDKIPSDHVEIAPVVAAAGIVHLTWQPSARGQPLPAVVWLDVQTGRPKATAPITSDISPKSHFGPLFLHDHRLWTFSTAPGTPPQIVELVGQR
jgi:outer membrane protein assembly factor BamB